MTFSPKAWQNSPSTATPISAAALDDLETRLSAYTDSAAQPNPERVNTVTTSGAAQTLPDVTSETLHKITLTANCTLTLPAPGAGKSLTVVTIQDATGGRMITWATPSGSVFWPGGATPTYTAAANARDVTTFMCADGTNWLGFPAGYDLR